MNKMDHDGSQMERSVEPREGNVNPPSAKPKRQRMGRFWCSGVFNYELDQLDRIFRPHVKKMVAFAEKCPTTGRKHYQCYWDFGKRIRPKEKFSKIDIFWIYCKGNALQNVDYCRKEGSSDYLEIGDFPKDFKIRLDDLRDSQKRVAENILTPVDPKFNRTIKWFWEAKGEWGKTILYTYLVDNFDVVLTGGSESDMLCCVTKYIDDVGFPKLIVINQTYSKNKISYNGIESLADGIMFSGKYESGFKRFPRVQVVVFSNNPPDETKMGKGRFIVEEL